MVDLDLDKLERVLELANASYAFVHRDAANTILDATPALIAAARRTEHWVTAATEARVEVDRLRALCREAAAALDAQRMHEETCRRCVCRVERDVAGSLLARLRAAGGGT